MDINKRIQEILAEKEKQLNENLKSIDKKIANERELLKLITRRTSLPEETDALEKLQKANGSEVVIQDYFGEKTGVMTFKNSRIIVDGKSYLLAGDPFGIKMITDRKTHEVIFYNPYLNKSLELQYAMLFGRKKGIAEAQHEIDLAKEAKEHQLKSFERAKATIQKYPEWIERGSKLVYPQRRDEWTERVLRSDGLGIEMALKAMELLAAGETVEEVQKIFEHYDEDSYHLLVLPAIIKFSKRGPEFYRKTMGTNPEDASQEDTSPDWLKEIESENKKFERSLATDGKQ